jgi:uncharacterized protein with PQ loop repeat
MLTIDILSWFAIVLLVVGYWLQVWRIHLHKEVRDISMPYMFCLLIGFLILAVLAVYERSLLFFVKQVATSIPVAVIIGQVIYHRRDHWHDAALPACPQCNTEIEPDWRHCPTCGLLQTPF